MKLGLYCVARYKRFEEGAEREFIEYGAPFVAYSDETACFEVREAIKDVKDKLDLSLFSLFKVGEFCPDLKDAPVIASLQDFSVVEIVPDCSALFEVKVDE